MTLLHLYAQNEEKAPSSYHQLCSGHILVPSKSLEWFAVSYQINAMTLLDQLVLHEGHLRLSVWVVAAMLTAFLIDLLRRPSFPKNAPAWWRGNDWPIMGALRFYSHRASYMNNGFQHTSNAPFSFYIGQKHIIALAGDAGRRVFYDNKELKLAEG